MSMISSLIDELRQMADGQATFHDAREVMLEAADTIWELRCRLVDAEDRVRKSGELCKLCEREAENAKLQNDADLLREMLQAKRQETHALMAENAKLRELVARMAEALGIDCEWADPDWCKSPCRLEFECWPEDMAIRCTAWAAMRDLGVEVDG